MSFQLNNLRKVTKSAGATWWSYHSDEDSLETILADHYFDLATNRFSVRDWIYCHGKDHTTIMWIVNLDPLTIKKPIF